MTDFFEKKYQVLMKEWQISSDSIGRLDNIVFTIRGWAITVSTGSIAYSYTTKDPFACVLVVLPIMVLWLLDSLFKAFQNHFISRNREIEAYLSSPRFQQDFETRNPPDIAIPAMAAKFDNGNILDRGVRVLRCAFLRNVMGVYVSLVILALMSFLIIDIRVNGGF